MPATVKITMQVVYMFGSFAIPDETNRIPFGSESSEAMAASLKVTVAPAGFGYRSRCSSK